MRIALSIVYIVLVLILGLCTFLARKSHKSINKALALLVSSLIPPVFGNLCIIASNIETLSIVGCYIYFIGMNYVMFALIQFTYEYCEIPRKANIVKYIVFGLLFLDTVQILINLGTGHVFGIEKIVAYGSDYFKFIPQTGLLIHRILDYLILGAVIIEFIIKAIISPKVYAEKYYVILIAMVAVAAWQTFYIITGTPVDISMIGFAVFGVLVFLLSIYYRPLRLLDRMLATIASRMPEALFFFDTYNRCVWTNKKASEMLLLNEGDVDHVTDLLKLKIGEYIDKEDGWNSNVITGAGENILSYVVEKHSVIDYRGRAVGYYLSVRDNSNEQKTLQKETYNAKHDTLTKALNRAGYDNAMENVEFSKCFLLLIDLDSFKAVNDTNGHVIGDKVLIKVTDAMYKYFDEDSVCRIGGDEFAIIIQNADEKTVHEVDKRIREMNNELNLKGDLPPISVSAGGAFGKDAENSYELYNNADHALYETKFKGKRGFTLFKKR